MKKNSGSPVTFYTMGVAALFLAGFFLLVVFGARTYRQVAAGQERNNQTRALLSYLSTCVKSGDRADAVRIQEGPGEKGSPMLVVADQDTGYGIKIYLQEGSLLEEYSSLDAAPDASAAQEIGRTEVFQVEELSDGTFAVTTDAGRTLFSVRGQSAAEGTADE